MTAPDLRPGAVHRITYTRPGRTRAGRVIVAEQVPCCGREAGIPEPRSSSAGGEAVVLCVPCKIQYRAEVEGNVDGGWDVTLTVDDVPFTTTRAPRRRTR